VLRTEFFLVSRNATFKPSSTGGVVPQKKTSPGGGEGEKGHALSQRCQSMCFREGRKGEPGKELSFVIAGLSFPEKEVQ